MNANDKLKEQMKTSLYELDVAFMSVKNFDTNLLREELKLIDSYIQEDLPVKEGGLSRKIYLQNMKIVLQLLNCVYIEFTQHNHENLDSFCIGNFQSFLVMVAMLALLDKDNIAKLEKVSKDDIHIYSIKY